MKLPNLVQLINTGYGKLFSSQNRLTRLQYLKGNLMLTVIMLLLIEILKTINSLFPNKIIYGGVFLALGALAVYYCGRAFIGRLHDIGLSAWYFFGVLLIAQLIELKFPSIALVIMVLWHSFAFIFPGKKYNNKYGMPIPSNNKTKIFIP